MMERLNREIRLFTQPGQLAENINEFLVSEGSRDADEFVFSPDLGPGKWAEAVRLTT